MQTHILHFVFQMFSSREIPVISKEGDDRRAIRSRRSHREREHFDTSDGFVRHKKVL